MEQTSGLVDPKQDTGAAWFLDTKTSEFFISKGMVTGRGRVVEGCTLICYAKQIAKPPIKYIVVNGVPIGRIHLWQLGLPTFMKNYFGNNPTNLLTPGKSTWYQELMKSKPADPTEAISYCVQLMVKDNRLADNPLTEEEFKEWSGLTFAQAEATTLLSLDDILDMCYEQWDKPVPKQASLKLDTPTIDMFSTVNPLAEQPETVLTTLPQIQITPPQPPPPPPPPPPVVDKQEPPTPKLILSERTLVDAGVERIEYEPDTDANDSDYLNLDSCIALTECGYTSDEIYAMSKSNGRPAVYTIARGSDDEDQEEDNHLCYAFKKNSIIGRAYTELRMHDNKPDLGTDSHQDYLDEAACAIISNLSDKKSSMVYVNNGIAKYVASVSELGKPGIKLVCNAYLRSAFTSDVLGILLGRSIESININIEHAGYNIQPEDIDIEEPPILDGEYTELFYVLDELSGSIGLDKIKFISGLNEYCSRAVLTLGVENTNDTEPNLFT